MANQRVELPPFSMWVRTPIYEIGTDEGKAIVFGLLGDAVVPDPTDILYKVTTGALHRLDLISHNFYGVPDLWWVIARCNGILDPLIGPALGQELRIPAKGRLAAAGILSV